MDQMTIYNILPVSLQNLACSVKGSMIEKSRYGKEFDEVFSYHMKMEGKTLEEIQEYQVEKLKRLLAHCYEHVPYYRTLFDKISFDPYAFNNLEDMKKLPILTKATVQQHYKEFWADNAEKENLVTIYTGGTTGAGLKMQRTQMENARKWAIWWRYRNRLGISRDMTEARFASQHIVPVSQEKPPYWRKNTSGKVIYFSQYHLSESTVEDYYAELEKEHVEWIHGYASIIARLAYLMERKGLRLQIPHITCGAENLYESQASLIEKILGSRPFQHYGQVECAANFSQYPDGKIRIDEDFCYVEFVKSDERELVVGTNLHDFGMPLLRYSVGDCASLSEEQDGGWRIVNKIDGREVEYVRLKNGRMVSAVAFDDQVFSFLHIGGAQIFQDSLDAIQVHIVPTQGFSEEDENILNGKLKEIVGKEMEIKVNKVEKLMQEKNGKYKLIISRL